MPFKKGEMFTFEGFSFSAGKAGECTIPDHLRHICFALLSWLECQMAPGVDLGCLSMRYSLWLPQSTVVTGKGREGEGTIWSWTAILKQMMTSVVRLAKGV